jgi:glutathione S-transferase
MLFSNTMPHPLSLQQHCTATGHCGILVPVDFRPPLFRPMLLSEGLYFSSMVNLCSLPFLFLLFSSEISSTSAFTTSRQHLSRKTVGISTSLSESNNNPFQSLFGNVASKISNLQQEGMMTSVSQDQLFKLTSLTQMTLAAENMNLNTIRSSLESKQNADERRFRSSLEKGYGAASPLHKLRLFDESNDENDVRVTLYRDSASWCPYCQKVWITLELKRIPYRIEKINMRCYGDKPASFLRMQPSGNIPVAIIDGVTYNQSNDIMYALEETFPDNNPLVPTDPDARMRAQSLLRLERQIFSAWMYWLTSRDTPDGDRRMNFISTLIEVEDALTATKGGFFLGEQVSIVDAMFAPFLERMCASLLYFKGFQIRVANGETTNFPAINRWFDSMETLESYQLTKSDYYTHCWDLPPQLGGCVSEEGSGPFQDSINGVNGSWDLPLAPDNNGLEPDWSFAGDEAAAKREAVERVTSNFQAISSFAARGAGKSGRSYGAPLSDPNAVSNESIQPFVHAAIMVVCSKLLSESDAEIAACDKTMNNLVTAWKNEGGNEVIDKVAMSLAYLRDRVGVPRDMRLPAARQLRAHLNWAIATLQ